MHIKNFDPYDFNKKEIEGVPVYWKNLPWAPCVHFRFVFNVGGYNDPIGKEGLAHFLEHMMGDGSSQFKDKKALKEFSKKYMLHSRNAYTSLNQTAYIGKCLPENFEIVINGMKSYICDPLLREEDLQSEKQIITQEAWGRFKNEKFLTYTRETEKNLFHGHARSRITSPLGWPETISKITREDIINFHKKNYIQENLSIFLVGNISEENISTIESIIAALPHGSRASVDEGFPSTPLVNRFERNSDDIGDPQEQSEFGLFRVTPQLDEKGKTVASQMIRLLQDLLHERLRLEHSLCYGVSVRCTSTNSYMEYGISVKTDKEKISIVEKDVYDVIQEIQDGKWKERFIMNRTLTLDQLRSEERLSDHILGMAVSDILFDKKITTLEEIIRLVEKVEYEDIIEQVKGVFDPKETFTEIILAANK